MAHVYLSLSLYNAHLPVNTSLARAKACAQVVPACMGSTIHGVCSKLTWFAINLHMVFGRSLANIATANPG